MLTDVDEDLQDLLEPTPKRMSLFILGDWNAKVESQEIPLTGKFCLGVQNEAGQRLTEFCQEKALVIANTPFQQHETTTRGYNWGLSSEITSIHSLQSKMEKLYTVSKNKTES